MQCPKVFPNNTIGVERERHCLSFRCLKSAEVMANIPSLFPQMFHSTNVIPPSAHTRPSLLLMEKIPLLLIGIGVEGGELSINFAPL